MNDKVLLIPMPSWDAHMMSRLGGLMGQLPEDTCAILVDAQSEESIPKAARAWVLAGKACFVRGCGSMGLDRALELAARLAGNGARVADLEAGETSPLLPHERKQAFPGVSVLIPTYQAGAYVTEAIESVYGQSHAASELVVVDDGSNDDSAYHAWEALLSCPQELSAALVLMPHRGQAAGRNTALACSSGSYVFYLDADDVLEPRAIEQLLGALESHPDAGMVCACCQDFISPELSEEEAAKLKINPVPYRRMLSGCTMTRRQVYDAVGPYDETLASSETAQWMLRMKDRGFEVVDIEAVTLRRRYHRNNFGRRSRKTQLASYMAIIKQRRAGDAGKR